ncbi:MULTISPECIES: hypothetical protein [Bradyrhizobium]|uniref:hypothetical protein n=1 Tax=Bradyrhizobium TaxID=374 RepID=UPI00202340E6|nr:hypothetical protein [Bradyrhizobium denitrificans]MCL8483812.1 hypothetical protein [Bradyrhizobium denitrificans]
MMTTTMHAMALRIKRAPRSHQDKKRSALPGRFRAMNIQESTRAGKNGLQLAVRL